MWGILWQALYNKTRWSANNTEIVQECKLQYNQPNNPRCNCMYSAVERMKWNITFFLSFFLIYRINTAEVAILSEYCSAMKLVTITVL